MKTKGKRKLVPSITAFWDTSALVPLCCFQPQSATETGEGEQSNEDSPPDHPAISVNTVKQSPAATLFIQMLVYRSPYSMSFSVSWELKLLHFNNAW